MNALANPIQVGLLGPLTLDLDRRPIVTTAPKQRQVLALLAMNVGRVVSVPTLVEELWGDGPPRSYATTLQTYILQVRNAIAAPRAGDPAIRRFIRTQPNGYVMEGELVDVDVELFDARVRVGREAAERGDHLRASEELGRALALWRGPAFVDVRVGPVLEIDAVALEECRLRALELRIEADLALGRHADLVPELTRLSAQDPLNENIGVLLIIALYRCGRMARAMQTFNWFRCLLKRELGVEPGRRMQRLLAAIRDGTPALESGCVAWLMHDEAVVPFR